MTEIVPPQFGRRYQAFRQEFAACWGGLRLFSFRIACVWVRLDRILLRCFALPVLISCCIFSSQGRYEELGRLEVRQEPPISMHIF